MRIIIDAMSGDSAPHEIVKGALDTVGKTCDEIVLCGKTDEIMQVITRNGYRDLPAGVEIINASELIEMHDDPANAVRVKKDSSMSVALRLLSEGRGDAVVSAGNTGALLTGATLIVKRISGIRRAALAPYIPNSAGGFLLVDAGANAECTAEYLLQFAVMGSYYTRDIIGIKSPRVGLLNIGTEPGKGTTLQLETYALLEKASRDDLLLFIGNVEGKEVMTGACDVLVCDGFTGNIFLKTLEGVSSFLMSEFKAMYSKNTRTKLSAALVKNDINAIKNKLNADVVGGSIMLGISKPVIKAHGSSNALAISSAIRQAVSAAEADIASRLTQWLSAVEITEKC